MTRRTLISQTALGLMIEQGFVAALPERGLR
jgi:hypothetical protein